jgi:hypothetical protein
MENLKEMKTFLSHVDSIQSRFMESLITGKRDLIFSETEATRKPELEEAQTGLNLSSPSDFKPTAKLPLQ